MRLSGVVMRAAAALCGLGVMHAMAGVLPAPPRDPASLASWATQVGPAVAVISLVRVSVVAIGWYCVGVTALGAVAHTTGRPWLQRGTAAISPRWSRRLAEVVAAGILLGAPASASAAWAAPTEASETVAPGDLPVMHLLPPEVLPSPPATPVAPTAPASRTVAFGDHFWRLAATSLEASLGRVPTAGEIAPYWLRLIAANRDRLVRRGDPDLIFAGQEMTMPPLTPGPSSAPAGVPMT